MCVCVLYNCANAICLQCWILTDFINSKWHDQNNKFFHTNEKNSENKQEKIVKRNARKQKQKKKNYENGISIIMLISTLHRRRQNGFWIISVKRSSLLRMGNFNTMNWPNKQNKQFPTVWRIKHRERGKKMNEKCIFHKMKNTDKLKWFIWYGLKIALNYEHIVFGQFMTQPNKNKTKKRCEIMCMWMQW